MSLTLTMPIVKKVTSQAHKSSDPRGRVRSKPLHSNSSSFFFTTPQFLPNSHLKINVQFFKQNFIIEALIYKLYENNNLKQNYFAHSNLCHFSNKVNECENLKLLIYFYT